MKSLHKLRLTDKGNKMITDWEGRIRDIIATCAGDSHIRFNITTHEFSCRITSSDSVVLYYVNCGSDILHCNGIPGVFNGEHILTDAKSGKYNLKNGVKRLMDTDIFFKSSIQARSAAFAWILNHYSKNAQIHINEAFQCI